MDIRPRQKTLAKTVSCCGVGVHSGRRVRLTLGPAPVSFGIRFVRTDLPGRPEIPGLFNRVVDTSLATVIGGEGAIVSTIEHLMAAFSGLSIDNAIVELDGYEVPIMDGSAGPFTRLIREAGVKEQAGSRCVFMVNDPIELREGDRYVAILPSQTPKITCTIDFKHPLVGQQSLTVDLDDQIFEREICDARTFGFLHEVEFLKRMGLARGGALENAVVLTPDRVMNEEGLRYEDEFVRHKILDCIGDFSLLGMPIMGHVIAHKSGHQFNHLFLEKFFSEKCAWETLTCFDSQGVRGAWAGNSAAAV